MPSTPKPPGSVAGGNSNVNIRQYDSAKKAPIPRPLSVGDLPAKYKPDLNRVRLIIIALPIAIVMSLELYRRRFEGVKPKQLDRKPAVEED